MWALSVPTDVRLVLFREVKRLQQSCGANLPQWMETLIEWDHGILVNVYLYSIFIDKYVTWCPLIVIMIVISASGGCWAAEVFNEILNFISMYL